MKNKISTLFMFLLTLIVAFIIVGSVYYYQTYPRQDFDVILFTFTAGVENTSSDVVHGIIKSCIGYLLALWILLLIPTIKNVANGIYLKINRKKKKEKYNTDNIFINNHKNSSINTAENNQEFALIKTDNIKWYKKVWKSIKNFFRI